MRKDNMWMGLLAAGTVMIAGLFPARVDAEYTGIPVTHAEAVDSRAGCRLFTSLQFQRYRAVLLEGTAKAQWLGNRVERRHMEL